MIPSDRAPSATEGPPAGGDHRALIEEPRHLHHDDIDHEKSTWGPWCYRCQAEYPCLPARLADALAELQQFHDDYAAHTIASHRVMEELVDAAERRVAELEQQLYQERLAADRIYQDWAEKMDQAESRVAVAVGKLTHDVVPPTDDERHRYGLSNDVAGICRICEPEMAVRRLVEQNAALLASQAATVQALARSEVEWNDLQRIVDQNLAASAETVERLARDLAAARGALIRIRDMPGADDAGGMTWMAGRIASAALADAPTAPPSECPLEAHREMHNLPEHLFVEDFQRFCRVCGLTESHGRHVAALEDQ